MQNLQLGSNKSQYPLHTKIKYLGERILCQSLGNKTPNKQTAARRCLCTLKMPRPASPLWEHFRKEMPNKRATCNYCGFNMCGLILRMRTHLARKCKSCPEAVKAEMVAELSRRLDHGEPNDLILVYLQSDGH